MSDQDKDFEETKPFTDATGEEPPFGARHEFQGRIFPGVLTYPSWSIAIRLIGRSYPGEPDEKREMRLGMAIAAQIGMNHTRGPSPGHPVDRFRTKLRRIQEILDE